MKTIPQQQTPTRQVGIIYRCPVVLDLAVVKESSLSCPLAAFSRTYSYCKALCWQEAQKLEGKVKSYCER
eukprot:scaffold6663_cov131-Skeletonema_marinoi.AAC.3